MNSSESQASQTAATKAPHEAQRQHAEAIAMFEAAGRRMLEQYSLSCGLQLNVAQLEAGSSYWEDPLFEQRKISNKLVRDDWPMPEARQGPESRRLRDGAMM